MFRCSFFFKKGTLISQGRLQAPLRPLIVTAIFFREGNSGQGTSLLSTICIQNKTPIWVSCFVYTGAEDEILLKARPYCFALTNRSGFALWAAFRLSQKILWIFRESLSTPLSAVADISPIVVGATPCGRPRKNGKLKRATTQGRPYPTI